MAIVRAQFVKLLDFMVQWNCVVVIVQWTFFIWKEELSGNEIKFYKDDIGLEAV